MDFDNQGILRLRRSVAFGDCDPAGIVYTPRVLGFCLEAIDDFWKVVLGGTGWYELATDHDRGTPFVNVNIDFKSPITPRDPLDLSVGLVRVGASSVTFTVLGQQSGRDCFRGDLTSVVVETRRLAKVKSDDWVIAAARAHFSADRPTEAS